MKDIKFQPYLDSKGLTIGEARSVMVVLDDYINRLEDLTRIDSLVEITSVNWERGANGAMEVEGHIEKQCMSNANFIALPDNLEKLATAKALKSWLSDAVAYMEGVTTPYAPTTDKTYDNIFEVMSGLDVNKHLRPLLFAMLPKTPKLTRLTDDSLTTNDYFASLSANDLARYYAAQAAASTIGDYIHPDGHFASERIDLVDKIANPCVVDSDSKSATVYRRIPTVDIAEVDKMYFALQALQRDHQKDVNSVKFKAEDAIAESEKLFYQKKQKIDAENQAATAQYNDTLKALVKEINDAASQLRIAVPAKAQPLLHAILSADTQPM